MTQKSGGILMIKKQNKNENKKKQTELKNPEIKTINPMEALLKKQNIKRIKKGEEIEATILSISKKSTTFDIGAKANAVLGEREVKEILNYLSYLSVGDKVLVRVISEESKDGYPVVSMQKYFDKGKWEILIDKKNKEQDVDVFCGNYGKGGVFVDFMGIRGVIPKIQLTEEYLNNPSKLQGQKIKVKVLEVDKIKNRLVVSQKSSVFKISNKELKKKFDLIKECQTYKAKVLGVSEFGIFCEVNGVEGLVHISELSWEKVLDISSYAASGDTIDVYVVEKNKNDFKLNLSIKRLSYDPWQDIEKKYPKDKEVEGEIVRKEKYGYFVKLESGIEGLIHSSKLSGKEEFKPGQKVKAYIERINKKLRRLSLILAQKEKPITYR
jgi:ribosomal protein S1